MRWYCVITLPAQGLRFKATGLVPAVVYNSYPEIYSKRKYPAESIISIVETRSPTTTATLNFNGGFLSLYLYPIVVIRISDNDAKINITALKALHITQ